MSTKNAGQRRGPASHTTRKGVDVNVGVVMKVFDRFRDREALNQNDEPYIGVEGLERLCQEMGVDPSSRILILLQRECGCATMGEISQSEFLTGMQRLGLDGDDTRALKKMGSRLKNIDRTVGSPTGTTPPTSEFQELYKYTFELSRESKAKKVVDKGIALGMFQLVLAESKLHHVEPLCVFLEQKTDVNVINADQWSCMLDFVTTIAPDFANFSSEEAWPVILDDYAEEMKKSTS